MWEKIKAAALWIKTNITFCGGLIVTILLALVTYYKRRGDSLETEVKTVQKKDEIKTDHEQTEKAEKDYDDQKKSYDGALAEYNRKYRSGNSGGGSDK